MRAFEEKRKRTRRRHEKEFAQLDHRGRPKKNLKFMSERFTSIASTTIVVCGGHFFRTGEVGLFAFCDLWLEKILPKPWWLFSNTSSWKSRRMMTRT
jgi:hypothetical protein